MEDIKQYVTSVDCLYRSMQKCRCNVSRKGNVQAYCLNGLKNTLNQSRALRDGTYKPKPTRDVEITYPKRRTALANAFPDRIYQRSLNDYALYPQAVKGFIADNMACQKGKGTSLALYRLRQMIHDEWRRNGCQDVYILQGDIHHYYDNMRHSYTDSVFDAKVDPWTAEQAKRVLHDQYKGETGYKPGSQMVQIAGISYLDAIDHYAKDTLRIKSYIRYMDDIIIVHRDKGKLSKIRDQMRDKMAEIGLSWHPGKTHIVKASDGIIFLGFRFWLSATGKVVMNADPAKVKANKRKIRRMVALAYKGKTTFAACDDSVQCMVAHMNKGDNFNQSFNFLLYYIEVIDSMANPREEKLMQYVQMLAAKMVGEQIEKDAAITDYNLMMGNLEDPNEGDESNAQ